MTFAPLAPPVIGMLLQGPAFDFGDLVENLGKIVVLVVFLIFPILKSIADSRRKAREGAGSGAGSEERRAAQTEARRRWEELLRGEVESPPPPSAPPPLPPPPRPPPQTARAPAPSEPGPRPLVVFDAPPPPPPPERSVEVASDEQSGADEESIAQEEIASRLRDERARRENLVRLEREAASARRGSAEPMAVPAFELETVAAAAQEPAPIRARVPWAARGATPGSAAAGLDRRSELRRAVIASEVLGVPLALRDSGARRSLFDALS